MTRCSVQPGDRIFLKDYEFLSFAKKIWVKMSVKT